MTGRSESLGKNDICALRVGERTYGMPAAEVLNVVPFPRLATLPKAPRLLLGVADLQIERDKFSERPNVLIPVVDVRPALGANSASEGNSAVEDWKYAVVTRVPLDDGAVLAIAAHEVWAASNIEDDDVLAPLLFDGPATAGKLRTIRIEGTLVEVVDAAVVAKALRLGAIG